MPAHVAGFFCLVHFPAALRLDGLQAKSPQFVTKHKE